jgi:hypothetical protein
MGLLVLLCLAVIPATPLVWAEGSTIGAIANGLLMLCVAALWCERERSVPTPTTLPAGYKGASEISRGRRRQPATSEI